MPRIGQAVTLRAPAWDGHEAQRDLEEFPAYEQTVAPPSSLSFFPFLFRIAVQTRSRPGIRPWTGHEQPTRLFE
jgi:hypothetical protein